MYFFKNLPLYSGAWSIQTKCIVVMTKEGSTKIFNFMTPRAGVLLGCVHKSYIVKMYYFFKKSSPMEQKIKYIVMMSKEGSTKIVNLMTPGTGVLC